MLHIDTRELHPGLIMSVCRSSRAEKKEKCGKRREGSRRRRRGRRRWWRRRRRRRSGRGEERQGREEQHEVQPRVPGGAQMFIPVDLSSPVPLVPRCPSSWSPMLPPSPPVLAEKERALGNPVLRSVASTLCVLLLLGCAHSGVATVSVLFDLANGNYDRLDRERKPLACSWCDTY